MTGGKKKKTPPLELLQRENSSLSAKDLCGIFKWVNSNASIILGFTLSVVICKLLAVNPFSGVNAIIFVHGCHATGINYPSDNFYLLFAKLVRGQAMCQIDLEFDHVITTTQIHCEEGNYHEIQYTTYSCETFKFFSDREVRITPASIVCRWLQTTKLGIVKKCLPHKFFIGLRFFA